MLLIRALLTLTLTLTEVFLIGTVSFCGRDLADMLDMVCYGRGFYWVPAHERHSLSKRTALSYLLEADQQQQRHRGVVEECCYRPCQISTLESYCAAPRGHYNPYATHAPMPRRVWEQFNTNATTGTTATRTSITFSTRRPTTSQSRRTRYTTSNNRNPFFFVGRQRHRTIPPELL